SAGIVPRLVPGSSMMFTGPAARAVLGSRGRAAAPKTWRRDKRWRRVISAPPIVVAACHCGAHSTSLPRSSPAYSPGREAGMQGLMQRHELLISSILEHAARHHGDAELVSRRADGSLARTNYAALAVRARKLASALRHLGVEMGDRVGTLAM